MPARILDLFVEFRCLTNGEEVPAGNSLLLLGAPRIAVPGWPEAGSPESVPLLERPGQADIADELEDLGNHKDCDNTVKRHDISPC